MYNRLRLLSIVAIAGTAFAMAPASALTLQQAQAELAGMYCAGSTCTSSTPGTRSTPGAVTVTGGYSEAKSAKQVDDDSICPGPMTFGQIVSVGGVLTCIPGSMIGEASTSPTVTYGPAGSVNTITTTTKELGYHPDAPARDQLWSVTTTVTTTDAP